MRAIFTILIVTSGLIEIRSDDSFLYVQTFSKKYNITKLLPHVHICKRYQPLIESCIRQSIESIKPYLANGIPRLDIPPFEPHYIRRYEFFAQNEFNATAVYKDLRLYGVTNFVVKDIQLLDDVYKMKINLYFPLVRLLATYNISGTILAIPIKRAGDTLRGNFTGITADITIDGSCYTKNCPTLNYITVHRVFVKLRIEEAQTYMDNLGNNIFVTRSINSYLNKHWEIIAREILPPIQLTVSHVILTTVNKIYSRFPIKTLMPP